MKNKILLAFATATFFSSAVYAVSPGLYMGLEVGPVSNSGSVQQLQLSSQTGYTTGTPENSFGSRVFLGYDVNKYAGVETGINYFSSINYKTPSGVNTCSGATIRVRDWDFLGKAKMPIQMIDVYGKAGLAVTYFSRTGDVDTALGQCYSQKTLLYKPIVSLGASYDLSQNWVADISWTRLMVRKIITSMDFIGVGISYHFVDMYCGQFLCD